MMSLSSEDTYPLSPLQRAALAYAERPLTARLEAPFPPDILVQCAEEALREHPELTAGLRRGRAMRIPCHGPSDTRLESLSSGGSRLVAGSLSLTAEPSGAGTHLTIDTDALFADVGTIESLCESIAGGSSDDGSINFFDVVADHAAMLEEGELDQEKAYWQSIPQGGDPRPALGAGPGTARYRTSARVPVDGPLLAEFASAHRVRLEDVLYLSLYLLLDRVCPQTTSLGRLIDARELLGLEGVSGLCSQVIVDAPEIDPEAPATVLLAEQSIRLRTHAEMAGGPALTEDSYPPTVIFDPRTRWRLPDGWRLAEAFEGRSGALILRGAWDGDDLTLVANTCDGTKAENLLTMLAAWADIVAAVVREPDTPWGSLSIGTTGKAGRLGADLPTLTDRAAAEDICVRVYDHVAVDPETVAVHRGEQVLTRRALLGRIGVLVAAIRPLELGAVVAVLADPEPDLIAAWLAVLWQGAAFLPLSPTEPRQRIEQAISMSAASTVLVGDDAPTFSVPTQCRVVRFRDLDTTPRDPGPPAPTVPDQIAYLLRTSGSTGTPKLVAVSRGSLNNYLRWVVESLLSGNGSNMPVVSSPIFDASFKQLLGPPYAGRSTWLLESDHADSDQAYAELTASSVPFCLNCTPSYWAEFLNIGGGERRLPLRKVFLGGEPVSEALVRRTMDIYPDTEIWNFYGPTETTATATAGRLAPGEPIHVGTAIAGAAVIVADYYGRPLPCGLQGEVWIAGPGLAKGYLGTVDQTSFCRLRVGDRTIRAYRSGDTGRIDECGRLRIGPRIDNQLKLRGWRIEPQEIERIAETTPRVIGARLVLDTREGTPQMRLFVLGDVGEAAIFKVLRDWLPTAMVPATVTRVARFPRTATGKLDHEALLDTATTRPEATPDDYEPLQLEIATIWRDIVGQGWPRVDEDFFNAGGHSLLLARLVNQLRARGHNNISLSQVVRNPTVNSIAAIILATGSDQHGWSARYGSQDTC